MELYTDASLTGFDGFCGTEFFKGAVIPTGDEEMSFHVIDDHVYNALIPIEHCANINVLELLSIMLALERWQSKLCCSRVLINCDNLQICYMLCKDRSSNMFANKYLKTMFWSCVSNKMYLSPCYIYHPVLIMWLTLYDRDLIL